MCADLISSIFSIWHFPPDSRSDDADAYHIVNHSWNQPPHFALQHKPLTAYKNPSSLRKRGKRYSHFLYLRTEPLREAQ